LNQKERATEQFEQFWKLYPRRVAKKAAEKAFARALKAVAVETLIAGAQSYARRMEGTEPEFVAHASSWLNGERWADEPEIAGTWQMLHRLATTEEPLELTR
jgi:hypothetical protein